MDFTLTQDQKLIAESARKVAAGFGLDYWRKQDEAKAFPRSSGRRCARRGCAVRRCGGQRRLRPRHAGTGADRGRTRGGGGGSTVGQLFMINPIFGGVSISRFGSPEMKRDLLPKIISGEINCCMALTEPDAGSNSLEIKTFATKTGNGWRLNGRKIWITGVEAAAKMLVVARTTKVEDAPKRTHGLSMFMIDVKRKGLTYAPIAKLGTNTLSSCNVFFDDVEVDGSELIGTRDGGWYELLDVLNTERIVTTAGLVGAGNLAIRLGVDYANERRVFGKTPVSAYQGLQFPLAQYWAELSCARLMNLNAATLFDSGEPYGTEANVAKLIASQAASAASSRPCR